MEAVVVIEDGGEGEYKGDTEGDVHEIAEEA